MGRPAEHAFACLCNVASRQAPGRSTVVLSTVSCSYIWLWLRTEGGQPNFNCWAVHAACRHLTLLLCAASYLLRPPPPLAAPYR